MADRKDLQKCHPPPLSWPLFPPAQLLAALHAMATLVFDIETLALPADSFDEVQCEYLFRDAKRLPGEAEQLQRREEIQRQFSLWPLTAQVACIAMLNVESERGQVLYLADDPGEGRPKVSPDSNPVEFVPCPDEPDVLSAFWDVAKRYDRIVTFNGRGFDVPFLYLRSAVLSVPISRKDWLGYRFQVEPHCDLAEQLTFYGVSGRDGAARRFNLDFYCKAFGIESSKAQGVTGMDVGRLIKEGRSLEVAEYCLRDVRATAALYRCWQERLAGIK